MVEKGSCQGKPPDCLGEEGISMEGIKLTWIVSLAIATRSTPSSLHDSNSGTIVNMLGSICGRAGWWYIDWATFSARSRKTFQSRLNFSRSPLGSYLHSFGSLSGHLVRGRVISTPRLGRGKAACPLLHADQGSTLQNASTELDPHTGFSDFEIRNVMRPDHS